MKQFNYFFALLFYFFSVNYLPVRGAGHNPELFSDSIRLKQDTLKTYLVWLQKQVIREELNKLALDLLKQAVTYTDVYQVLRITRWDASLMRSIPALVPLRYAQIKNFRISSGFGFRKHPVKGDNMFHGGIDIPAPNGTPVYAVADGIVSRSVKYHNSLGNFVQLNHYNGFITYYGHLLRFIVHPGQSVKQGQIIGYVGESGLTTGNHLHYILIKNGLALDPYPFCFLMYERYKAEEKLAKSSQSSFSK
ncbi:M23 family metallopeptidase [Adhaeribacter aquaticus]|uniref:M23 family metallopeptidase n=1 Tax=Adhaeribacter aquaticus TaxID=299567 RepID=UPI000414CDFB|nr:M23 family metallopeptidase [Adhaeribacter aquaticus]